MPSERLRWPWITALLLVCVLPVVIFHNDIAGGLTRAYRLLSDRDQVTPFLAAFGNAAPLAFMGLQILQVILAPVPGEATGFIGGYLFGAAKGFVYSSLALAMGSWINFAIGRYLGKRFVRKWIPAEKLARFDNLLKRQGIIVLMILFLFPGFPKDYLCLFLGATAIPVKAFLTIATFGRMPGTLLLSLQGEFLFEKNYRVLGIVLAMMVIAAVVSIHYREHIYRWMEKLNGKSAGSR